MIIYTDGACSGNGTDHSSGGFGVVILDDEEHCLSTYAARSENTTNNREELKAIIWTAWHYGNKEKPPIVFSDSAYCVNTLTDWMFGWERKGWVKSNNQTPENLDLIQAYYKLWQSGYRIDLRKCRGHAGNQWNEMADQLATGKLINKEGLYG